MEMVYLIHFEKKLAHAQHYIGYARDVEQRMQHHKSGKGARILQVLNELGISYEVVRVWKKKEGTRKFERKLKNRHNAKRYCPICQATYVPQFASKY